MPTQISDPSIVVNNLPVAVVPNSVAYTEGFGEQDILVQSAGNGVIEQVFSDNVETNLSMVKFSLRSTVANIALARQWKANRNTNAVTLTATTDDGTLTRTFSNAAITNDPEVNFASDGVIEVEFKSNRAVS